MPTFHWFWFLIGILLGWLALPQIIPLLRNTVGV